MVPISPEPTLAEVIARHEQDATLTPKRRRDLKSAVLRMSEITGVDPRSTPVSLRLMRPRINAVRPAKYNLTPKTWSNLRSNFRAAVVQALPRQPRRPDPEWGPLRAALPNKRMKNGLSRLIGFCESNTIPPTAVCDAIFDFFRAHLEADTNVPCPPDCHRLTCRLWNEAAATVPGWPPIRLSVPDHRRPRRSLPISSFPVSLQEELARYFDSLRGGDLFSEEAAQKRIAPSTVHQRSVELGLALSALVGSGRDPASITSLACLVEPSAFTSILRHYLKDGKPRPFAHNIAQSGLVAHSRRSRCAGEASPPAGAPRQLGGAQDADPRCGHHANRSRDRHSAVCAAADRQPGRAMSRAASCATRWAEVTLANRHPATRGEERSTTRARASQACDDASGPLPSTLPPGARSTRQSLPVPGRADTQRLTRILAANPGVVAGAKIPH